MNDKEISTIIIQRVGERNLWQLWPRKIMSIEAGLPYVWDLDRAYYKQELTLTAGEVKLVNSPEM